MNMRLRKWTFVLASVLGLVAALVGARLAFGSAVIDSVSPAAAPNTGSVVLTVNGSGFLPGSAVRLVRSGQLDVPGDDVVLGEDVDYVSPSRVRATFDLTTRAPGRWDVKATQLDGTGTCSGCFSVAASKPTVTSVTPGSRGQGADDQQLVIKGTNFARGATVVASGSGIELGEPRFDSPTQLTVAADVARNAPVGPQDISVKNTDGQIGTCAQCLNVNGAPQINAPLTPASRGQGAANQDIVISGSNFVTGATVSFGPDVTVNKTTVNAADKLTANVSVSPAAAPIARDVTVTNGDGGVSDTCDNCFTVNRAPAVASASPASRGQGAAAQTVTITGAHFINGATVAFSGSGIRVDDVAFESPLELVVQISIEPGAASGARDVAVTNPDAGTATCAACFTVNSRPAVASVAPSSRGQGADGTVTVTGSNFAPGADVSFAGTGITVESTTVLSPTQLAVDVAIASDAPASARDVTVANSDGGSGACAACFTVNTKPAVTSVTPSALGQRAEDKNLTIKGTSFADGATVSFAGSGVTVNSVDVEDAQTIVANVTVGSSAATGTRTVTVRNADGADPATCAACFRVNPAPAIDMTDGVNPASRGRGATRHDVTIHGSNFVTGSTVAFSGDGVSIESVTFNNPQELVVKVTVAPDAGLGPRDVTVSNPDSGHATCSACFTVAPAPSVNSSNPGTVGQGASNVDVTIVGAGFADGATATFGGSDIVVNSTEYTSPTTLVANVTIDKNAATGAHYVLVTNPDGGTGACETCFWVSAAPRVSSISPAALNRGAANRVLSLSGTAFNDKTSLSFSGTGITLNSLTRQSATSLKANVSLATNAATGARDVMVGNADGGRSVCAGCFSIGDGPVVNEVSPSAALNEGPITVTMDGAGFVDGSTAVLKFAGQPDIAGTAVTPQNAGRQLKATFDLTFVAPGARTLVVTAPSGATDECRCFAVAQAAPQLDSVSPNRVPQGAQGLAVTLSGEHFAPGATVSVSDGGVSIDSVAVQSAKAANVKITVAASAEAGERDVTVTNSDGQDSTCRDCLTVSRRPTIASAQPATERQGATSKQLTIDGDHFAGGAQVSFSGGGISVSSVQATSERLIATYSIAPDAAIGKRDVVVTNPDSGRATCAECFTVKSAPTLTSVSPAAQPQGASEQVITLAGTNFFDGADVSFSGSGITVDSLDIDSNEISATVSVGRSAATGPRSITLTNPDGGTATCTDCFTVSPAPAIGSLSPASMGRGASAQQVLVTGANFVDGATVSFSGTGLLTGSTTRVSATQLRTVVTVDGDAPLTARDVTVTNPDGGTVSCTGCFLVTDPRGADFNRDGQRDILWHNAQTGQVSIWLMNRSAVVSSVTPAGRSSQPVAWKVRGTGDFNFDGRPDILWHNSQTGQLQMWLMNGTAFGSAVTPSGRSTASLAWTPSAIADFNADRKTDILWHNSQTGQVSIWLMNGTAFASSVTPSGRSSQPVAWKVRSAADFNNDGKQDILWHNSQTGQLQIWTMNGTAFGSAVTPSGRSSASLAWTPAGTGDFNADSNPDILWHNSQSGQLSIWTMNGTAVTSSVTPSGKSSASLAWRPV